MNKARVFYYCFSMFLVILISNCSPKTSSQIIKDEEVTEQIAKEDAAIPQEDTVTIPKEETESEPEQTSEQKTSGGVTYTPSFMPGFPMVAGENVMIMWVPVPGAVKYKIYKNGKEIAEVPAPPLTTPTPKDAGVFKYTIAGVDANNVVGPVSKEGMISIVRMIQPETFTYTFIGDVLNITWSVVPNAVIYDVYKAEKAEGPYSLLTSQTEDRYVDSDVKKYDAAGKSFFYKVVAKDKLNNPSPDNEYHEVKVEKESLSAGKMSSKPMGFARSPYYPPAHGGTTPPNAEPYDAVFFENYGVNPFVDTEDDHLSTFAVDVDSASYTIARKFLQDGNIPPGKAIRTEEFINYFDYGYTPPEKDTFSIYIEGAPSKFGKNCSLLKIGIKGRKVKPKQRKNAILTFVIDVSGSMQRENRLDLVKRSLRLLVDQLTEDDKIGIVIYGSRGEIFMEHKGLDKKTEILLAIDKLIASGSTFAEEGIRKGYELASKAYQEGYINRIILCSDGVANVGQTGADGILEVIKNYKEKGITLSSIGFGMGNFNDVLLEKLGDKGDGHYAYVDTIAEAKRVFVENLTGTLQVIAKDTKVQVDFNPETVRSYRLIGYENRDVADDKFRDDKEDGGEVGAGHSVTALYEVKFWPDKEGTLATVYIRYKKDETDNVEEINREITKSDFKKSFDETSADFRLAATVAEFAEILKKSYWAKESDISDVLTLAQEVLEEKKDNADVIELTDLISKAKKHDEKQSSLSLEDKSKQ